MSEEFVLNNISSHKNEAASVLLGMTFHHSIWPGSRHYIPTKGNVSVEGQNSSGKSSILAAMLVFQGANPNSVTIPGKKSFTDYYLPTQQSLLVYDYLAQGEHRCVALFRGDAGELLHCFVKGKSEETIFSETITEVFEHINKGAPAREVFSLLEANSIECSKIIRIRLDYVGLLFNNKARLPGKAFSREDIANYSLMPNPPIGDRGQSYLLAKLSETGYGASSRKESMQRLKNFLASVAIGQSETTSDLRIEKDEGFAVEAKAIKAMEEKKDSLMKEVGEALRLPIINSNLKAAEELLLNIHGETEKSIGDFNDKIKNLNEVCRSKLSDLDESRRQCLLRRQEIIAELTQKQKEISDLTLKYLQYQQEGVPGLSASEERIIVLENRVAELRQEKANLEQHSDSLTKGYVDTINNIRSLSDATIKTHETAIAKAQDKLNALNNQYTQDLEQMSNKHQEKIRKLDEDHSKDDDELKETLKLASRNRAKAGDWTESEKAIIDSKNQEIEKIQSYLKNDETELEKVRETKARAKEQQRGYEESLTKVRINIGNLNSEIEKNKNLISKNNLLFAFLESQDPGWQSTLGKILSPRLLTRGDLKPEWVKGSALKDQISIYGLMLDLENIEIDENIPTKEKIENKINEQNQELQTLISQEQSLESFLKKANAIYDDTLEKEREVYERYRSRDSQYKALLSDLEKIESEFDEAAAARVSDEDQKIEQIEQEMSDLTNSVKASKEAAESALHAKEQELKTLFNRDKEIQEQTIKTEKESVAQAKIQRDEQLEARTKIYEDALKGEVNPEQIENIKQFIETEKSKLKTEQDNLRKVREYKSWLANEYSSKQSKEVELEEVQAEHDKYNLNIERLEKNMDNIKSQHSKEIKEIEHNIGKLKEKKENIEANQRAIGDRLYGMEGIFNDEFITDIGNNQTSLSVIVSRVKDLLGQHKKALGATNKALEDINAIVGNSPFSDSWQNRTSERLHKIPIGGNIERQTSLYKKIISLDEFKKVIEVDLPLKKSSLVETFRAKAFALNTYQSKIDHLISNCRKLANDFSESINKSLQLDIVKEVSVNLSLNTDDQEMYKKIGFFKRASENVSDEFNEVPDDETIRLFIEAINSLQSSNRSSDPESMVNLTVSAVIAGNETRLSTNSNIGSSGSTGATAVLHIVLFASLVRFLCKDNTVKIFWPVDEIATIDETNVKGLAKFLEDKGVYLFATQPELKPELSELFGTNILLENGKIIVVPKNLNNNSENRFIKELEGGM